MAQMVVTAREEGASQLLGLCPKGWMRWMRRLGYETEHVGPCLDIGGSDNQAIMMRLIQVYLSVDVNYYLDYKNSHIHQLNYRYTRIFDNVIREGIERGYLDPQVAAWSGPMR